MELNLHSLELFYHVACHAGQSQASRKMSYGIQPCTISRQICRLERATGFSLYTRQPFQLTPAGEQLFNFIKPMFEELPRLIQRLGQGVPELVRLGGSAIVLRVDMKTAAKTVSMDQIKQTMTALQEVRKQMPFVLPLSAAERRDHRAARLGPTKLRQLENRLVAARQHRELLPPAFDLRKFERDAEETIALGECLAVVDEMYEAINDTLLAVGNRAAISGATAYAHIQVAAVTAARLKRTVEKLAGHQTSITAAEPEVILLPAQSANASTTVDAPINPTNKAA